MKLYVTAVAFVLAVCFLPGCATIDNPAQERANHVAEFSRILDERTAEALKGPVSLEQCLNIAFRENYDVKKAELDRKLASYGKDLAFASFLPGVDISASLTTWSRQPAFMGEITNDKTYREFAASGVMPILMPSVWFMYANMKLGVDIAEIAAHYARQSMILDVTAAYFTCLAAEDDIETLEAQLKAAESQYKRVSDMAKEELAAKWESDQAYCLFRTRETELAAARRALVTGKAELLMAMGLSPMQDIQLDREGISLDMPEGKVEELVLEALKTHPSLSIADHTIVANENAVRTAICDFLPTLSGFANATWTSDSFDTYNKNLLGGFSVAWNVFSGFAKLANYKTAKVYKEASMLDREATFLAVICQVVRAQAVLADAVDGCQLAETVYGAAKSKFVEYENRQKEGLVTLNDMLEALADMDEAQATLSRMNYSKHLALAALKMSMGTIGGQWLADKEAELNK